MLTQQILEESPSEEYLCRISHRNEDKKLSVGGSLALQFRADMV